MTTAATVAAEGHAAVLWGFRGAVGTVAPLAQRRRSKAMASYVRNVGRPQHYQLRMTLPCSDVNRDCVPVAEQTLTDERVSLVVAWKKTFVQDKIRWCIVRMAMCDDGGSTLHPSSPSACSFILTHPSLPPPSALLPRIIVLSFHLTSSFHRFTRPSRYYFTNSFLSSASLLLLHSATTASIVFI